MDKLEAYEIIRAGRKLIKDSNELNKKEVDGSTTEQYIYDYQRMVVGSSIDQIIQKLTKTNKKSTYYKRRAALLFGIKKCIESSINLADKAQKIKDFSAFIEYVGQIGELLSLNQAVSELNNKCPLENTARRKSKKADMRGLPPEWREIMETQMRGSVYYEAFLISAISGCRPDELKKGVSVRLVAGFLEIKILGSKYDEKKGQEWRSIKYLIPSETPLINLVVDLLKNGEKDAVIKINSTKNWSNTFKGHAKTIWPKKPPLTPYCLRHQFASDLKKSSLTIENIAKAMGHSVDETQKYYGRYQMSRSKTPLIPSSIDAPREIRRVKTSSDFILKKSNQQDVDQPHR